MRGEKLKVQIKKKKKKITDKEAENYNTSFYYKK